jgi:hypothetical protein
MGLKNAIATTLCAGLLISGSAALADDYRAGQLLGLDLSEAVLSPKRLGPQTEFAPVRIEARGDSKPVKTERVVVAKEAAPKPQVAEEPAAKPERIAKPRVAARRTKPRSNPLDAQARDTRIQTWPCKSGGICGWQN